MTSSLSLAVQTAWCVLVILVLGAYRTISLRTLSLYLVAGVLAAVTAVPVVERAFSFLYAWPAGLLLLCGVRELLLLSLLLPLFRSGVDRALSNADVYLLGFAVGMGYQLAAKAWQAFPSGYPSPTLTLFPPWQSQTEGAVIAGYPYWTALAALAASASGRQGWKPVVRWAVAGAVLLVVLLDQWLAFGARWMLPASGAKVLSAVFIGGRALAWLSLGALIALSAREVSLVARKTGRVPGFPPQRWISRALARRAGVAASQEGDYRSDLLSAQRANVSSTSNGATEPPPGSPLEAGSLAPDDEAPASVPLRPSPPALALAQRVGQWALAVWPWLAAVLVLFVLPAAPRLAALVWSFPPLRDPLPVFGLAIVQVALAALVLREALAAGAEDQPEIEIEGLTQRNAVNWLRLGALGTVLLAMVYVNVGDVFTIEAFYFTPPVLATALLLLGLAGARSARRSLQTQADPGSMARQGVRWAPRAIAVWAGLACFSPLHLWLRGFDSALLRPGDLRDAPGLQTKIKDAADPVSGYLRGQLSSGAQQQIAAAPEAALPPDRLRALLVGELNRILVADGLFDPERFKDAGIAPALAEAAANNQRGEELVWVNRQLLQGAYPGLISVRTGWWHTVMAILLPLLAAGGTGLVSFAIAWGLERGGRRWLAEAVA